MDKLQVGNVTFNPGPNGVLDQATVLVQVQGGFATPGVSTPWFQIVVQGVHSPDEAVTKARDPLVAFLKEAEEAAKNLKKGS